MKKLTELWKELTSLQLCLFPVYLTTKKKVCYVFNERDSAVPKNEWHSFLSWLKILADVSLINCSVLLWEEIKFDGNAGNVLAAICMKVFPALAEVTGSTRLIGLGWQMFWGFCGCLLCPRAAGKELSSPCTPALGLGVGLDWALKQKERCSSCPCCHKTREDQGRQETEKDEGGVSMALWWEQKCRQLCQTLCRMGEQSRAVSKSTC